MAVQLRNFHAPFHCWRTPGDNQACSRLRLYHSEGRQYDYRGSSHSDFAVPVQVVRIRQKRERGSHNRHQELAHSDQLRKDGKSVTDKSTDEFGLALKAQDDILEFIMQIEEAGPGCGRKIGP